MNNTALMQGQVTDARAELVACLHRVSRGDRSALEELYRRTSAKLFAVCKRILSDRAEAEDVLQEVYLIVWRKAAQFDPERGLSPVTWLVTIARNRALDRLRAHKDRFRGMNEAADILDDAPLADAALAAREISERLAACLQALDERTAAAIRAAFFGGHTYDDLAKRSGLPLGSMKSLIRRGLARLRDCLS